MSPACLTLYRAGLRNKTLPYKGELALVGHLSGLFAALGVSQKPNQIAVIVLYPLNSVLNISLS